MFKSKILNFFKRCYTSWSNIILMAFASGGAGEESVTTFKRYKGIAAVSVLAINPNKAKLKELTGRELQEEPKYLFKFYKRRRNSRNRHKLEPNCNNVPR